MFALSIRCLKISVYQYITMVYWYSDIYTVLENIRISMYHNFCKVIQKPCHHQRNSSVNTNWVKSSIALAKTDPGEAKRTEPDGPVSWTHPYCVRSPQWPPPSTQVPSSFSWSHSCLGVFIWGQTNLLNIDIFKTCAPRSSWSCGCFVEHSSLYSSPVLSTKASALWDPHTSKPWGNWM